MIALLAVHVRHRSWDVDSLRTRRMTLSVPIAPKLSLWLPKGKILLFVIHTHATATTINTILLHIFTVTKKSYIKKY